MVLSSKSSGTNKRPIAKRGGVLRIAVTGGLCSGKSTVLKELERDGFSTMDSTRLAATMLSRDTSLLRELENWYCELRGDKRLIMNQHTLMRILPQVQLHPNLPPVLQRFFERSVRDEVKHFLFTPTGSKVRAVEDALVFETKSQHLYDEIWLVATSPLLQKDWLKSRDQLTELEASQLVSFYSYPTNVKMEQSTHVLTNSDDYPQFKQTAQALIKELRQRQEFARRYC